MMTVKPKRSSERCRQGSNKVSDLTVLEKRYFRFLMEDTASVDVQITQIRFKGHVGYVREKRRGYTGESFHMSSNTRLGHKADGDRIGREVLELTIDKRLFDEAAEAIHRLDGLHREVLRSNRWSRGTAEDVWARAKKGKHVQEDFD